MIPRNLYLVQHAEYKNVTLDPNEGLSDEGIFHAKCLAKFLIASQIIPEFILCSPKTRSKETAKIINQGKIKIIESDKMKAKTDAIETLNAIPDGANDVLLVGHLPNLQEIAKYFNVEIDFEMAGVGYFNSGRLKWYITPTLIRMAI